MNNQIKKNIFLGISDSHDSGVALIANGQIVAAINEERLSRKKMVSGFPKLALQKILEITGVRPQDIDGVGFAGKSSAGENMPTNNDFSKDSGQFLLSQRVVEFIDRLPGGKKIMSSNPAVALYRSTMPVHGLLRIKKTRQHLKQFGIEAPIQVFDHHDAHLASAYYSAGQPDALVISNDAFGDGLCSKVAIGNLQTGGFDTISSNPFFNSLGVYYNYATLLCGFPKGHHAGKTTGLAAFGDSTKTMGIFQQMIQWDPSLGVYVNHSGIFRNSIELLRERLASYSREDIAAGVQQHCENILTEMVRHFVKQTQRKHVVLVGGMHANVKVNQRIAEIPGLESIFVFPNMGDGGLALGGAYLAMTTMMPSILQPTIMKHVYFGPEYPEAELLAALGQTDLPYYRPDHYAAEVAQLLAQEKVVARFDGAMEFGPRSLGNRSILYSAAKPEVNGWLNQQLNRTEFMPFAPVIRELDAPAFFENYTDKTAHTAEFMTITYNVTDRCRNEAPATVHVDGTARPQILKRDVNAGYYDILTEYQKLTGLSVLVNTSFNMHEEPIVCSPQDAIKAFLDSNIDVLALGPFIVKNPSRRTSKSRM